jgi:transcriptional regulator with XRE-family HTH domain
VAYLRNKEYLIAFGSHLKKLREERNMSQSNLAYDCGMEISQVSRMERGILNTSISNIYLLAKALNIHPKELFDFKIPEKKKK